MSSAGSGGTPAAAGSGAAGSGGTAGATAGRAGSAGAAAGSGGSAGSAAAGSGAAGSSSAIPEAELEALRVKCVDYINMYRAMVGGLQPMKRASAAQEACSDKGAQMDGDSGMAHGSARAGLCRSVGLGAEDTCPGWPVGGFSGNATVSDALTNCLDSMWDEGEPPVSRSECQADYAGCFLKYGHYLNMSDPNNKVASCGFYKMKNGAYWMNQDFAF